MDTLNDNPHFTEQHPKLAMLSTCLDSPNAQDKPAFGHQLLRDLDPADCKIDVSNKK
jgi:membrane protein